MKRFELKFLDGPGRGRSVWTDKAPPARVWLCRRLGRRWLAVRQPEDKALVEATYRNTGIAERLDGTAVASYGVDDEKA